MGLLTLERSGRVAFLTLNRQEKRNALSMELLRQLITLCDDIRDDDDVALVVLRGTDGIFSAGADLLSFMAAFQADDPRAAADLGRVASLALSTLPQLTVAAIEGACLGGGMVLTSACDLRWATGTSWFSLPEAEVGIPLGWGALPRLIELVGESAAVDLVVSSRRVSGDEAVSLGFVSRTFADMEAIESEIDMLGTRPSLTLRTTKQQLSSIRARTYEPAGDADLILRSLQDAETLELATNYLRGKIS